MRRQAVVHLGIAVVCLGSALGCGSEPLATTPDASPETGARASRLPHGFVELWRGGPVLPDTRKARDLIASLDVRRQSFARRSAPSFRLVQGSSAQLLEPALSDVGNDTRLDVNAFGVATGTVFDGPFPSAGPALWPLGTTTATPLPKDPDWSLVNATAINDAGTVVGDADAAVINGTVFRRVVVWSPGAASAVVLPPLSNAELDSYAAADIAPNGDVLGSTLAPFPPAQARIVVWKNGSPTDLGSGAGSAVPIAMNGSGAVLATFSTGPAVRQPVGTWVPLASSDPDVTVFATDIAPDGTAVGGGVTAGPNGDEFQIIVWDATGAPTVIPPPAAGQHGFASAVSSSGSILLSVFDASAPHALAYLLDGADYSPLPSTPPSETPSDWVLDLDALAGDAFAVGAWRNVAGSASSLRVRWSIEMPNVAPVVTVPATATATAGMQYAVQASFTDRFGDGPWGYSINWGDGSQPSTGSVAATGAIGASKLYKQAGGFTVTVSITDRHGATGSAAYPLSVLKRNGRPR